MGIRVRKALGYGLMDFKGADDPRIRQDVDFYEVPPIEEFVKFCNEKMAFMYDQWSRHDGRLSWPTAAHFSVRPERTHDYTHDAEVFHDDEFGLKNVLLIVPYGHPRWHRYDDIMDYVEEGYVKGGFFKKRGTRPWVKSIPAGIYPYIAWMDARTGVQVEQIPCILDMLDRLKECSDDMPLSESPEFEFREIPSGLYRGWDAFRTIGDVRKYLAPKIPWDVTALCRFLRIFKNDTTILQLRPMMYCYWA